MRRIWWHSGNDFSNNGDRLINFNDHHLDHIETLHFRFCHFKFANENTKKKQLFCSLAAHSYDSDDSVGDLMTNSYCSFDVITVENIVVFSTEFHETILVSICVCVRE